MTTQWERDQIARGNKTRRLLALVEAATAALPTIEDPGCADDLRRALDSYNLAGLRRDVAYYDEEDARRQREVEVIEKGKREFEELPDAPERLQCEAHVARNMGRWTDFGRCEKAATRVIMDWAAKRERVVCTIHAKEFVTTGRAGTGFERIGRGTQTATHESWYRIKGWCMSPDPHPDPRKPTRYCRVRVDTGSGQHEGKEHRWS